jgi:GNAT superfamily N-acetyltransferase
LRRSITELCVADHANDPAILMPWLANKTPEIVASWIARSDNAFLVAIERGTIYAVGAVTDAGEITLNYVSPDKRFCGVSRAMLGALQARAIERGNLECTVTSTKTAHRFYRSNDYVDDAVSSIPSAGSHPMRKVLRSSV